MTAYYNEIDPFAAAWLRELIKAGLIASGDVDERDIKEVEASDLQGYVQCHFFAGIGGWSYALRLAGWEDSRPVWTGSCPCQPFSAAGKQKGEADSRHLWPEWFRLIRKCQPSVVFGEQVEAAVRHGWLDLVSSDLEGEGYAIGAAVLGAHSVGAPHRRQRLWFVAQSGSERIRTPRLGSVNETQTRVQGTNAERERIRVDAGECGATLGVADAQHTLGWSQSEVNGNAYGRNGLGRSSDVSGLVVPTGEHVGVSGRTWESGDAGGRLGHPHDPRSQGRSMSGGTGIGEGSRGLPVGTAGAWSDLAWLPCRDGIWRPTQSGLFPLAHGTPCRVGRLRGYGNAIVPQVAAEFIKSYKEAREEVTA